LHSPQHPTSNTRQPSLPPAPAVPTVGTHVPDTTSPHSPTLLLAKSKETKGEEGETGAGAWPAHTYSWIRPPTKGRAERGESRRPLPAQLQQARVRPRKGSPPHPTIAICQALPTGAADLRRAAHMPPPLRLRGLRARRPLLDSRTANWGREYACADGQGRTGRDVSVRQRKRRELGRGIERGRRRTLKVAACSQCGRRI
jgi:hypothetical protein